MKGKKNGSHLLLSIELSFKFSEKIRKKRENSLWALFLPITLGIDKLVTFLLIFPKN